MLRLLAALGDMNDAVRAELNGVRSIADKAATDAAKAQATGENARQMVINRDPTLASLSSDTATLAQQQTALEKLATTLGAAIPASEQVHTLLAQRIAALEALKVQVAFGTATITGSLLAGATASIVVNLSRNMGSATYSVGYALAGGTSLLGQLQAVGVTAQTATTVTVQVKNTGLTSLANLSTASVSVVAARDVA